MTVGVSSTNFSVKVVPRNCDQYNDSIEEKTDEVAKDMFAIKNSFLMRRPPGTLLLPHIYKSIKGTDATIVFTQMNGHPICIKMFHPVLSINSEQEIQFTKQCSGFPHSVFFLAEHKVKVDSDKSPSHAMILEYVSGPDLQKMIFEEGKRLLLGRVFMLAKQGFEFLRALHEERIIHGDMSPKNVIWDQKNRQFIFVDFGSSMNVGEEFHKAFSRGFESFEKLLGLSPATSQDIWSFACLLFFAYTGQTMLPELSMNIPMEKHKKFYQTMQLEFGEFSESLIERSGLQRKYQLIKSVEENRGNMKKWKDRIRDVACRNGDSEQEISFLIRLLERMLSYENRITAEQALRYFPEDIGFYIDFPDEMFQSGSTLVIQYPRRGKDRRELISERFFDLSKESTRRRCHHIPRSFTDKYKISVYRRGRELFTQKDVLLKQDHRLQIAWKA